jgi:hypothetical protein
MPTLAVLHTLAYKDLTSVQLEEMDIALFAHAEATGPAGPQGAAGPNEAQSKSVNGTCRNFIHFVESLLNCSPPFLGQSSLIELARITARHAWRKYQVL